MRHGWKVVLWSLLALTVYLTAECFLPPSSQPLARLGVAMIHGYQATGSKVMQSSGVHCRYEPSCAHYAEDAISHYGTVSGLLRTCGRLWRCSPWGGSGYDPAVEEHSAAYVAPQQETPEDRKAREDAQKKAAEDFRKAAEDLNNLGKDFHKHLPEDAGKAVGSCVGGCVGALIFVGIHIAIMVVALIFVWKDSKARGDANAMLWMVLVFVFSWVGAIAYLVARPKGDFSPCPSCHKQRLATLTKCPHCSVDSGAPPKPA